MPDLLVRGIDRDAGLRIVCAVTTDLVTEAARRHHATHAAACALGRGLTSSLLLATLTKGKERVTVQIEGDGPLGGVVVDATIDAAAIGAVRGYVVRPDAPLPPASGRCQLSTAIGRRGVVNITRDLGLKENYQGQVPLLNGEVDEDVESYLRHSEQVPSALGCDVLLRDGAVVAAAGVLVQAMPGGEERDVRPAQHALRTGAVYDFLKARQPDARALAEAVYGRPIEFLGEQPLAFQCRCSRERVEGMLHVLTPVDIDEMIAESGHAEITCNFCNEHYIVEREPLERIRAELLRHERENN